MALQRGLSAGSDRARDAIGASLGISTWHPRRGRDPPWTAPHDAATTPLSWPRTGSRRGRFGSRLRCPSRAVPRPRRRRDPRFSGTPAPRQHAGPIVQMMRVCFLRAASSNLRNPAVPVLWSVEWSALAAFMVACVVPSIFVPAPSACPVDLRRLRAPVPLALVGSERSPRRVRSRRELVRALGRPAPPPRCRRVRAMPWRQRVLAAGSGGFAIGGSRSRRRSVGARRRRRFVSDATSRPADLSDRGSGIYGVEVCGSGLERARSLWDIICRALSAVKRSCDAAPTT